MAGDARISPRSGSINRSNLSRIMKHYTHITHFYEPIEGLVIEIEHDGRIYIRYRKELCDLRDFDFTNPEDAQVLVAIADTFKLHYQTIIHHTLTPTSDEQ